MGPSLQSALIAVLFADMAIMLGVGGRLLYAAARTRRAAEGAIGTSATAGALSVILGVVVAQEYAYDPDAFPVWVAARSFAALGVSGLAIGAWRIFRPDATGAAAAAAALCSVAWTAWAMRTLPGAIEARGSTSSGLVLEQIAGVLTYGWATVEAGAYHVKLRRRLRLGLTDPLVAHRFLLWCISGSCALGAAAAITLFTQVLRQPISGAPAVFIALQLAMLLAALCLWFAFFPPGFYRRRIERSAASAESAPLSNPS